VSALHLRQRRESTVSTRAIGFELQPLANSGGALGQALATSIAGAREDVPKTAIYVGGATVATLGSVATQLAIGWHATPP